LARGIDGQDPDGSIALAETRHECVEEGRFSRPGRTGDADAYAVSAALEQVEQGEDARSVLWPVVVDSIQRFRKCSSLTLCHAHCEGSDFSEHGF
jgi:hypothetical protein